MKTVISKSVPKFKKRVILSGVSPWKGGGETESKDPGGSITYCTGKNRRDPSTALRPPFRLRSAQDDTHFLNFGTPPSKSPAPLIPP